MASHLPPDPHALGGSKDASLLEVSENEPFPIPDKDDARPFPEDFAMRGLIWAENYFPEHWFTHENIEIDSRPVSRFSRMARQNRKARKNFIVKQKGINVLMNGRKHSAFGDTGAGQDIISDRLRRQLGLKMRSDPTSFPMGNSNRIFSPGTVELPLAFEDDPTNIITIVAHVVQTFAYDLLLGNPSLQTTKCLTEFKHRFVQCLFSMKSMWAFNLLGETTQRFQGTLGKGVPFLGLPDIGSVRNVMDAGWAEENGSAAGFNIMSEPENCGWILYPDGTEDTTIGQALTTITLADGISVPIVFELLPNCHVPVVLGQDFVFDHDIYSRYATSILEYDGLNSGDQLMPMGFKWSKAQAKPSTAGDEFFMEQEKDDLERQLEWNLKYQDGRTASIDEWNLEYALRERYELSQNPTWHPDPTISLIEHKPNIFIQHPDAELRASTQSSTRNTLVPKSNSLVEGSSDASNSA